MAASQVEELMMRFRAVVADLCLLAESYTLALFSVAAGVEQTLGFCEEVALALLSVPVAVVEEDLRPHIAETYHIIDICHFILEQEQYVIGSQNSVWPT